MASLQPHHFFPIAYVASFLVTVGLFVLIVRSVRIESRVYWILGCSIASIVWLGIVKGIIASVIGTVLATGFINSYLASRRFGKKIAKSFGVEPNLFFTSLERV